MRLEHLHLRNFRQHVDTRLELGAGLTGVIGPNGAGKSTLLEAIAWAIYGSAAARGTNDTLRFSRAEPGARVSVELGFELAGHDYRVVRTLEDAKVYLDGGEAPVATSIRGATRFLRRRLGMTRDEFFNTYFTGQKELQFLAQLGPTERGRFLSQVLGYQRLRLVQERARERRNELRYEIEGLRIGLPDPALLEERRAAAVRDRDRTAAELEDAVAARRAAQERLEELEPRWVAAQAERDRARELAHELEMARRSRDEAERELARLERESTESERARARLAELRERLDGLPALEARRARHTEQARLGERRRALEETERTVARELDEVGARLHRLERAPALAQQYDRRVERSAAELERTERELDALRDDWRQRRQEIDTKLEAYRERVGELQEQLDSLRDAGPDGVCPTCERPLRDTFADVVARLDDEWTSLVQDGKWLKSRQKQLSDPPEALGEARERRTELQVAVQRFRDKLSRCEAGVRELGQLKAEHERKRERLEAIREQIQELPAGYDADSHRATERALAELHALEREAARLEEPAARGPELARELERVGTRLGETRARVDRLAESLERVDFRQEAFETLRDAHRAAERDAWRVELRETELRGALAAAEQALERAREAEAEYRGKRDAVDRLDAERRHNAELDRAFSELRSRLNARVRPELGELASDFLAGITDGRYTSLVIDESYNILVLDEGEGKPVISGGEEDVAHLVLRLAISQMIAERAGHPLSVLILDEVFGSLDIERRDNVVRLLHRLTGRFEQVILITHVESIREGLDHVVRVDFDARSGASVVRDDRPAPLTGRALQRAGT